MRHLIATILLFLLSCQLKLVAGGPLLVEGGMAITYGTRPFLYRIDKGPVGIFSNSEAITLVKDLFGDWNDVSTSNIIFQQDNPGLLDFDVDATNFAPILGTQEEEAPLLGYTPIIFDTDGSLLNALLGQGAGNKVLGLAGPRRTTSGPLANQIAESQAIFNGKFVNGIDSPPSDPETSTNAFKGTIIHEVGHAIGLDHSQINVEVIEPGTSQELRDSVPLEFPIAVNDLFLIRRDDASSVSFLYPNDTELKKFGKIEGKVFRKDGLTPVLGANIIARNINDPKLEAISCVSDYLTRGTGEYILFAVPPGQYTIEVEPISLEFIEGSGVGPYTKSTTDLSFQNPVPKGFYTGPDLPITNDPNSALVVNVQAGQSIKDANIIASSTFTPGTSSGGTPTTINEIEPNNSEILPQVVILPVVISGNASISDDGDIKLSTDSGVTLTLHDIFKFTLPEPSSINILLTNESELTENDLDLVLLDEFAIKIIDKSSQTGNTDELISLSLMVGTYLAGVGAFSGTSPYKLLISAISEGGSSILSIEGQDTLLLQPRNSNKINLNVTGLNFETTSKCKVFTSNGSLIKVKPKKFTLTPSRNKKTIKVKVPLPRALELILNNSSETVTINVFCSNGANDEFDILLTPNLDGELREKSNWVILKK